MVEGSTARFELVAVAWMAGRGGRLRVLLAVDREGEQLWQGEPVVLVEHRPGRRVDELDIEVSSQLAPAAADVVQSVATELITLFEGAIDSMGELDRAKLLGRSVAVDALPESFGAAATS